MSAIVLPNSGLTTPSAAIVGMAAMVGAGTGGVMTAIIMIFEMTRDYAIIVPVIVAVAVAAGRPALLIPETIYTIKLRHRGHRIPKERHVNLYLVRQARDVMERRFIVAKAGTTLREAFDWEDVDDLRGDHRRARRPYRRAHTAALRPMAGKRGTPRPKGRRVHRAAASSPAATPICSALSSAASTGAARARRSCLPATAGRGRRMWWASITKRAIADAVIDDYGD